MKKYLSILLTFAFLFSLIPPANAAGIKTEELKQIGTLKPNIYLGIGISYLYEGSNWNLSNFNDDEIKLLLNVFSDETLRYENKFSDELAVYGTDSFDRLPKKGCMNLVDMQDNNWLFYFDEMGVVVQYREKSYAKQGYFKYKNYESYSKLTNILDTKAKELKDKIPTLKPGQRWVYNFKTVYSASFQSTLYYPTDFKWGICSYTLTEESSNPVYAAFLFRPGSNKVYFLTNDVKGNNTLVWDGTDALMHYNELGKSLEYVNPDIGYVYDWKLQLNLSENFDVQSAMLTKIQNDQFDKPYIQNIDMTKYQSSGQIPKNSNLLFQSSNAPLVTPAPTESPTTEPTLTPTATPFPTESPVPTLTPVPTESSTPAPSESSQPTTTPTSGPEPTTSPDPSIPPTRTPDPNSTPTPTQTPEPTKQIFPDVPLNHWAFDSINKFYNAGIVKGYDDGYFGTDDSITYEHFGFLLDRLLGYKDANTTQTPAIREDIIVSVVKALELEDQQVEDSIIEATFSDCHGILPENRKYIAIAIKNDLIIGSDGRLFPKDNLTRAETVVLLDRAIQKAGIVIESQR